MTMNISATNLIDIIIAELIEIQECRESIPHGSYITKTSPYYDSYIACSKAERRIAIVEDVLQVRGLDLYQLARTARKWYEKTAWQRCLPEYDANRLLSYMCQQAK